MLYYLDSSAWVKRYFAEAGRDQVNALFDHEEVLVCSTLGLVEVAATMARKRSAGDVNPDEFGPKRASLLNDWRRFLRIDVTPEVVRGALQFSDVYSLRGADSVHLASAWVLIEELKVELDRLTFVTSDQELKSAARKAGLSVMDPWEEAEENVGHPAP